MASGGKKKTTMAKLNRERKLQERRLDKQARKDARKYAASQPDVPVDALTGETDETDDAVQPDDEQHARDGVPALADA